METVESLWRYPVKSMMGEQLQAAHVTARGLAGDRAYAVVDKPSNRAAVVRTWATPLMTIARPSTASLNPTRRHRPSASPIQPAPAGRAPTPTAMPACRPPSAAPSA
jgi:uncharacterized protein YcbX